MSSFFTNFSNPFNTPFVSSVVGFNFTELHSKDPFATSFSTAWFASAVVFVLAILTLLTIAIIFTCTDCVDNCCCSPPKRRSNQVGEDMELKLKKI